jgi:hypothetical protein
VLANMVELAAILIIGTGRGSSLAVTFLFLPC